jgi:hypothetical protein
MTAKEQIIAFESEADAMLQKLGLWHKPMRSVVTALYVLADDVFTGGSRLAPGSTKHQAQAMRLISNLSYLAEEIAACSPIRRRSGVGRLRHRRARWSA